MTYTEKKKRRKLWHWSLSVKDKNEMIGWSFRLDWQSWSETLYYIFFNSWKVWCS